MTDHLGAFCHLTGLSSCQVHRAQLNSNCADYQAAAHACVDVDAEMLPRAVLGCVLLAQHVQHIRGVKAGVVAELARDDLQRLGISNHELLPAARNRARMVAQDPACA